MLCVSKQCQHFHCSESDSFAQDLVNASQHTMRWQSFPLNSRWSGKWPYCIQCSHSQIYPLPPSAKARKEYLLDQPVGSVYPLQHFFPLKDICNSQGTLHRNARKKPHDLNICVISVLCHSTSAVPYLEIHTGMTEKQSCSCPLYLVWRGHLPASSTVFRW